MWVHTYDEHYRSGRRGTSHQSNMRSTTSNTGYMQRAVKGGFQERNDGFRGQRGLAARSALPGREAVGREVRAGAAKAADQASDAQEDVDILSEKWTVAASVRKKT